jgi:6-pyruvoyltetrahydropterin/6-carboxytetrahydropterin synthase
MMVTLGKTFDFDAAHHLPNVPDGHKCKRMHGHTYRVELMVSGKPDERGMVCDYAEIAAAWASLHDLLDHRTLNDVPGLENPTTEILTPFILRHLQRTAPTLPWCRVRVYESATTWCEVGA